MDIPKFRITGKNIQQVTSEGEREVSFVGAMALLGHVLRRDASSDTARKVLDTIIVAGFTDLEKSFEEAELLQALMRECNGRAFDFVVIA